MAKPSDSQSEMALARQSDGINVIFDQESPNSVRSRSRSSNDSISAASSRSSSSLHRRDRGGRRGRRGGRHRSSSSHTSSSSTSSSRSRSRSHPRCYRRSSRCGCVGHRRYGRGIRRHSPPRRYRAHSRSHGRSASRDRYTRHGRYERSHSRSRSRSSGRWSRYRKPMNQFRFSRSPSRVYKGQSRSRSPGHSVSLSVHDKRQLLETAKANAMKILAVEKLELPESVKPILSEKPDARRSTPEPMFRVRQGSEKNTSQDTDEEPDVSSTKRSPRGRIAFSINNCVAKPTEAAPSSGKITSRVDSYESRKPYGHWIPIGSGQTSSTRKRKQNMSR